MELAVYGKGGIGKSTVSANLSAALALRGHRVLQIGCDPKHDSTRLLMHGKDIPTVLDYLKGTSREWENTDSVLETGLCGIGCIEAGGPKPGVGCAGRGIISAFEFLERHQVKSRYDTVVYDVLGDVVCGGFAVPVRREYADAVFPSFPWQSPGFPRRKSEESGESHELRRPGAFQAGTVIRGRSSPGCKTASPLRLRF